tara:strand:- start:108 stop:740 length:633 start_codon:yes stop_codon:yes gene_type:complete
MQRIILIILIAFNYSLAQGVKEFLVDVGENISWLNKEHIIYQSSLNTMFNKKENDIMLSIKHSDKTAYFKIYIGEEAIRLLKRYFLKEKRIYENYKSKLLDKVKEEGIKINNEDEINRVIEQKGYNIFPEENVTLLWAKIGMLNRYLELTWHFFDKDGFRIDEDYSEQISIKSDLNGIFEIQGDQRMDKEEFLKIYSAKLQKVSFPKLYQ